MIDFAEIKNYEHFEDLCESLLKAKGLDIRRLGRGPGQIGRDLIAKESFVGSLSNQLKTWMVEVKHTNSSRSITEQDIFNVLDRVKSQGATGYFLFTNARLSVNLEKTLSALGSSKVIDICIWTRIQIEEEILKYPLVFRNYFPKSFRNLLLENRFICLAQTAAWKSPLTYIANTLQLIKGLLPQEGCEDLVETRINDLIVQTRSLLSDFDRYIDACTSDIPDQEI